VRDLVALASYQLVRRDPETVRHRLVDAPDDVVQVDERDPVGGDVERGVRSERVGGAHGLLP
jgi:hypothetical protein